jgi:hypothetical protein
MVNPSNEEIRKKIRDLEDKIHDCKTYISSDFCISCNEMYEKINQYTTEIKSLKELYEKTKGLDTN